MFLARSVTGSFRAVKVVRREDFERERTFEREFEGIKHYEKVSQNHPGLVDVLHVGRNNREGFYYYVMELADDVESGPEIDVEHYEPRTLSSDLKRHRLRSVGECVAVGAPLAEALGHLHAAGLTHRDVKPSNIIFVKGQAKLADVGLVASSGQRTYVGTEGYVPPEGPGTASADLYSLAMVLYEMGTGKDRLDFPELPTNMELPPTVNRDEWRALNNVICRAGAPDPRRRYESGETFASALRQITHPTAAPEASWRRMLAATASIVLAAVLGAAGFSAYRHLTTPIGDTLPRDFQTEAPTPGNGGQSPGSTAGAGETAVGTSPSENPDPDGPMTNGAGLAELPNAFEIGSLNPRMLSNAGGSVSIDHLGPAENGGGAGGVVISDAPFGPPSPPKAPEPPAPPPKAWLKITQPSGASVWHEGKQIAVTPTDSLEFSPGPVEVVLKASGYHDYLLERTLPPNRTHYETDIQMLPDRGPLPGEPWTNSVGLAFEAIGKRHISIAPIGQELFDRFVEETRHPVGHASPAAPDPADALVASPLAAQPDDASMWAFCDWMTRRDRAEGFLDEGHFHHPQRDAGESLAFFSRVEDQFGNVQINSEPSGARVYRDGRFLGKTPLALDNQRIGLTLLTLKLGGYRDEPVEFPVRPSDLTPATVTLNRDDSVLFTEPYTNSLGMTFMPVKSFMASAFETRVKDYAAFLASGPEGIEPPNVDFEQGPDHPVAGVNLPEARAFCAWLTTEERRLGRIEEFHTYRLPRDLEWSAMAGLETEDGATPEIRDVRKVSDHFPWGDQWPPPEKSGNFADLTARGTVPAVLPGYDDTYEKTSPVGSFPPNPYELHDLSGNVWEWIDEPFSGTGDAESALYFVRGGGWSSSQKNELLTSYRKALRPQYKRGGGEHGFRCLLVDTRAEP